MRVIAGSFHATFSAIASLWTVTTDEFEIHIRNVNFIGDSYIKGLKCSIQEIIGENVEFEILEDWVLIRSWSKIEKIHLWDLYDPDKPKNLAKCVTVK